MGRSNADGEPGSGSTRSARNCGSTAAANAPRRTCCRQFHSSPRLMSYRRATSRKLTPGCSTSATIRSFSSTRQRRRRSTPLMISNASVLCDTLKDVARIKAQIHTNKAALTGRIHNCPREMSCRRATAANNAPGASTSATIRSLSAIPQRRRRPIPRMISTQPVLAHSDALSDVITSILMGGSLGQRQAALAGWIRLYPTREPQPASTVRVSTRAHRQSNHTRGL